MYRTPREAQHSTKLSCRQRSNWGHAKKEASDLLARYDVQQNAQNTHESLFMNPNFDTGFVLCTQHRMERDMHHRIVAKTSVKQKIRINNDERRGHNSGGVPHLGREKIGSRDCFELPLFTF